MITKTNNRMIDGASINVKDFGAVGDGVTDDTTAIQTALTASSSKSRIVFPAGTYIISSGLTSPINILQGEGAGITRLKFDVSAGVDLITFTASSEVGRIGGIENVEIIIDSNDGGYGIVTPKQADQYDTYDTRYIFKNIICRGETLNGSAHGTTYTTTCSDGWIYIADCTNCVVSNIRINGSFDIASDPSGQTTDRGIILDAASAILTARIQDIELGSLYIGIEPKDRCFYSIMNFDIISCYRGIYQNATTPYSEPKIGFGNINVQDVGIYLASCNARDVASVTIRRHRNGWASATNDWYAIKFNNVDESSIRSCHIETDESVTTFTGDHYAIYAYGGSGALKVSNCLFGEDIDYAMSFDNVAGFIVENNIMSSAAAMTYIYLSTNSRYGSINNVAQSTSSVTHTMLDDDGSVNWSGIVENVRGIERLPAESEITIASGVVVVTKSYHTIDTEADASTDDLDTITPPSIASDGMKLELRAASSDRTVIVKDGTGNIKLDADFSLTHSDDWLMLVYENSAWKKIAGSDNTP